MKIWLDDERPAPDGWEWVRTQDGFKEILEDPNVRIEEISFDHDLGMSDDEEEMSGYTCVRWLELHLRSDAGYPIPRMSVHSMNPVGRKNIEFVIRRIEKMKIF